MLTLEEDFRQVERLEGAIKAYRIASQRTVAFAMVKVARNLAFALFRETAKLAPSEATLREVPHRLGWYVSGRRHRKIGGEYSASIRTRIVASGGIMEEIYRRMRARKFHAAGWKPAMKAFVDDQTVATVIKKLGGLRARVEPNTGEAQIQMVNRAGVIEKLARKHSILKKAVNRVFLGIAPYIKRKLGEEARAAFWKI